MPSRILSHCDSYIIRIYLCRSPKTYWAIFSLSSYSCSLTFQFPLSFWKSTLTSSGKTYDFIPRLSLLWLVWPLKWYSHLLTPKISTTCTSWNSYLLLRLVKIEMKHYEYILIYEGVCFSKHNVLLERESLPFFLP